MKYYVKVVNGDVTKPYFIKISKRKMHKIFVNNYPNARINANYMQSKRLKKRVVIHLYIQRFNRCFNLDEVK